jgi:hypothetical protein
MTRKRKSSGEPKPGFEDWPNWFCDTPTRKRLMKEKVNEALDNLNDKEMMESQGDHAAREKTRGWLIAMGIKKAVQQRNTKELFAHFASWSKRPEHQQKMIEKLVSAKGKGGRKRDEALEWGSQEMDRIRQVWRGVYGLVKRTKDNGPSTEEIVVERWNDIRTGLHLQPLTVKQLELHRRKVGRPKPRRQD